MAQTFGHEKLKVYQKGMDFATSRRELLGKLSRRVSACDLLDRAAESILVNIAHASSSWSPKERIVGLGNANGSAIECAACMDVLVAKGLLAASAVFPSKCLLAEIVNMLIAMRKTTANRVHEDRAPYHTQNARFFFAMRIWKFIRQRSNS